LKEVDGLIIYEIFSLLHQIMEYIRDGHLNLIRPPKLIGGKENYKASEYTQQRERVGKTVLRLRDEVTHHLEQVMSSPRMPVKSFDESGSYLLVGGLGGIGRSISLWMVQNGARNLTFLTRGGGNRPQDQGFVDELKSMGCTVKLERGDVTDADNVLMAVDASNELAPLKGVMQLSMVLRDKAFERMSLEDWTYVMKPKVNGTWNLHNATLEKGCDLDFLLLFSSISGTIGQAGQANYSSANTFLDAFVEYRTGMGLPCSAIALGAMEDVGYLSEIENEGLLKKMQQTGWRGNSEAELLEALNLAVAGGRHSPKDDRRRVTTPNQFSLGIQEAQTRLSTDARLSIYRNEKGGSNNTISSTDVLQSFLATAKKDPSTLQATDAATIMAREIGKAILGLLSGSAEAMNIELDTKTSDLGLDSIIVGELHAWWKRNFGFEISVLELLSTGTLGALGMKAIHGLEKTI
jgi:aryl carrier-like protein